MIRRPAQGPDINLYPGETEKSWKVQIRRNGIHLDITGFTAAVYDDEVEVDSVPVTIHRRTERRT